MKKAEKEELGDNHVSEDVEKIGWGVEKAQESYHADASKSTRFFNRILLSSRVTTNHSGVGTSVVPSLAMKLENSPPSPRQNGVLTSICLYDTLGLEFKVLN